MATDGNIPPNVQTSAATSVTATSAVLNGNVIDAGQWWISGSYSPGTVAERGFYWSTSPNPTVTGTKVIVAGTTGAYTYNLAGLVGNQTYYFQAYCIPADVGLGFNTGYGAELSFVYTLPANSVQKSYIYQVYRQGQYIGLLPNVTSEFNYTQDINTAGVQINITCGISPDISRQPISEITDESAVTITDESGIALTTEGASVLVGNTDGAIIRNGNSIIVTEISNYYPNGIIRFRGDIQRWEANIGGSSGDMIALTAYSDGAELNNYLVTGGDTLDQTQATQNAYKDIWDSSYGGWTREGQTFKTGTGITALSAISVYTLGGANLTIKVYSDAALTTFLGSATVAAPSYGSPTEVKVNFNPIINVTALTTYFFTVQSSAIYPSTTRIYYSTSNPYANGAMYESIYGGGGGGSYATVAGSDLEFRTYTGGTDTVKTYTSSDPANMLNDFMTRYVGKGGIIKTTASTVDLTGLSVTYTFKVATILEAVQKVAELAPYNWYWYVDIATDTLYFKQLATTAKWTFVKGKDISSINMVATTENITNLLYFTGGNTGGGVNLFSVYTDPTSVLDNKPKLARKTDNRVTLQATADALGVSSINSTKNEGYQTSVSVLDATVDITKFKLGDTVGFAGFGSFVDLLVLQIVRVEFTPELVTLHLGQLPPRVNQTIKDIDTQLTALDTLANPSVPS